MGSIFTTTPNDMDQTSIFGTKQKSPVFLQFVPGVVTEVANSIESLSCNGVDGNVNSIKALPHIGKLDMKKGSTLSEKYRYYPLLRGMVDVPTEGDPVLLCSFGGVNYYLGPLNTENRPNKSKDMFANDQLFDDGRALPRKQTLGSRAFIPQRRVRLQKTQNKKLDFPNNTLESVEAINSVSPDMMFEGRHGNSIRIGSRNVHPYIMISNGRSITQITEQTEDNSIFCMFDKGSIRDHFQYDFRLKKEQATDTKKQEFEPYTFTLADEEVDNVYRSISKTFTKNIGRGNTEQGEDDPNIQKTIYEYEGPQTFLNSDRITFNAREESMFLSSKQFLHLGSGNSMTFSTSNNVLFEAHTSMISNVPVFKVNSNSCYIDGTEKIVLGNPDRDRGVLNQAVLGNKLQGVLSSLIGDIRNLAVLTAQAISSRTASSSPLETLMKIEETLKVTQTLMDGELNEETGEYQNGMLSKIVELK